MKKVIYFICLFSISIGIFTSCSFNNMIKVEKEKIGNEYTVIEGMELNSNDSHGTVNNYKNSFDDNIWTTKFDSMNSTGYMSFDIDPEDTLKVISSVDRGEVWVKITQGDLSKSQIQKDKAVNGEVVNVDLSRWESGEIAVWLVVENGENGLIQIEHIKSHDEIADTAAPENSQLINRNGGTIRERISPPAGFTRAEAEDGSFGQYLRNSPLKPPGSKVKYYNGSIKPGEVYEAVVDLDVGDRDLQQCADAVIRLRAEYLYGKGLYDRIHFNFTNGFKADYATWRQGNRIVVKGNKAYWVKGTGPSGDYGSFRKYLDMVFAYAGTLSLAGEMKKVPLEDMRIGDVFLKGEDPGHCVIVIDMAENRTTGEKLFMLAQSYMPAQDIHILKNPRNEETSPWYPLNFGETLITPEWSFNKSQLTRFQD